MIESTWQAESFIPARHLRVCINQSDGTNASLITQSSVPNVLTTGNQTCSKITISNSVIMRKNLTATSPDTLPWGYTALP